jgi:hypothetical protein
MWYSKMVEAGATDVLSGDIEIKETFNQTVQSLHRSFYGGGAIPNFESIYNIIMMQLFWFSSTRYLR